MSKSHHLSEKARPVSLDERRCMIAEAAYYLSERRGFAGHEDDQINDWLNAEQHIDLLLAGRLISNATTHYCDL